MCMIFLQIILPCIHQRRIILDCIDGLYKHFMSRQSTTRYCNEGDELQYQSCTEHWEKVFRALITLDKCPGVSSTKNDLTWRALSTFQNSVRYLRYRTVHKHEQQVHFPYGLVLAAEQFSMQAAEQFSMQVACARCFIHDAWMDIRCNMCKTASSYCMKNFKDFSESEPVIVCLCYTMLKCFVR